MPNKNIQIKIVFKFVKFQEWFWRCHMIRQIKLVTAPLEMLLNIATVNTTSQMILDCYCSRYWCSILFNFMYNMRCIVPWIMLVSYQLS